MSAVLQLLQSSPTITLAALGLLWLLAARLRSLRYSGPHRNFELKFGSSDVLGTRDVDVERGRK
jgi:hypothetical protein